MTASAVVGPLLANGLFALAISPRAPVELPGAPFFVGSVLCGAALWLAIRSRQAAHVPAVVALDAGVSYRPREATAA